jgi:protein-arginine kinase activator protein McsA
MATEKKTDTEKPLDKMTVKELREIAKAIPEITGVHGMNKQELLGAVKAARGIVAQKAPKTDASIKEIKKKIKALKAQRDAAREEQNKEKATLYRRRIARLKKKTRRRAA